jgi:exopolysaccharide biosynthesis protein
MRLSTWGFLGLLMLGSCVAWCGAVSVETKSVSAAGRSFSVRVVRAPLGTVRVKVGLAKDRVCATEPLASIAKRNGAVAAINGCFFNAYTSDPIKPPYHHLIKGGKVVHCGNTGTTLGFDSDGNYRMDRLKVSLRGGTDGKSTYPNNWYSYFINHPVENPTTAIIYDSNYVGKYTPKAGEQVVVRGGSVKSTCSGATQIPSDGCVLLFSGGESRLAQRFSPGKACDWRAEFQAEDTQFWQNAREALGCGPRLVKNGEIAYDPITEGFTHAKIISSSGARSAVGVTRDGTLLMVTCSGATVKQLASVMKALGAYDAMNLDGGASSCLWANGKYLTSPGRNIGNALLVVKK